MASNRKSAISEIINKMDCNIGRVTLNNLKKWKNTVHQVDLYTDKMDTHEEVMLRSVRVAERLQNRHLKIGDQIVICADTHNNICLPVLAAFYIGCTIFPLSTTMTIIEIKRMLGLGNPKIIFCDSCMEETFTRALEELNLQVQIVVFEDVHRDLAHVTPFSEFLKPTKTEDSFEAVDFDPDTTLALIVCSSGTTGLPKGVCHTYKSLGLMCYIIHQKKHAHHESGLYMNFSTFYWISGTLILLTTCLFGTPRLNCSVPFSIDLFEKGIKKYEPHKIFLSPVGVHEIVKTPNFDSLDLSCVRSLVIVGSVISENIVSLMRNKLNNGSVYIVYAASETGHISINNDKIVTDTVGKPLPWVSWKIINLKTGKEVKTGEHGELYVKMDTLFKCYLNNPEATQQTFESDGYFKTGDILKCDEKGYFYFIDRVKEVLKYKNYQITPSEIEMEIINLPQVVQVCVVGRKHEAEGEHPVAFVQKTEGSNLTEQDIKDVVKNNLADHKQLRGGVVFMDKLPQTVSGKIDRKTIKEMAQQLKELTMNQLST